MQVCSDAVLSFPSEQQLTDTKMNLSEEDLIDTCVQCGKRQNAVSNLTEQVFQVNTANKCGHKFCNSCIERELYKKRQFACPRCKSMVSRDKVCVYCGELLVLS